MKSRSLLLTFFLSLFFVTGAMAQDKIYMHNQEVINAHVKSVNPDQVVYRRLDNPDGPDYTVFTADVVKVVYANGSQDIINDRLARKMNADGSLGAMDSAMKYRNFIYMAPIQFTENGFGVSLAYERSLDKSGLFRFYLPVMATFNVANNAYTDASGNNVLREDPTFYAMPGIKVRAYNQWGNSIFLGTSMVFAEGQKTLDSVGYNNNNGGTTNYAKATQNKFMFGMMAHASAEVLIKPRIYFAAEVGFGWTYIYAVNNLPQNNSGLLDIGFMIGYRY